MKKIKWIVIYILTLVAVVGGIFFYQQHKQTLLTQVDPQPTTTTKENESEVLKIYQQQINQLKEENKKLRNQNQGEADQKMQEVVTKYFSNMYSITQTSPMEQIHSVLKQAKDLATEEVNAEIFKGYDEQTLKNLQGGVAYHTTQIREPQIYPKSNNSSEYLVMCFNKAGVSGFGQKELTSLFEIRFDESISKIVSATYLGKMQNEAGGVR